MKRLGALFPLLVALAGVPACRDAHATGTPDVRAFDTIVATGDSIEAGSTGVSWSAPLAQTIRADYTTAVSGATLAPFGYLLSGITSIDRGAPIFVHTGVAGDTAALILARLSTAVYRYNPTGVIVEIGVNDVTNGTPQATFEANVTAVIAGIRANCPNLRWIIWVGPICAAEVLPFGAGAFDTTPPAVDADHTLLQKDISLRSLSGSLSFTLVQFRVDAAGNGLWHDYEVANNPTNLPVGILTVDGRHLLPAGATFTSAAALAQMAVF
jgi:GDSL-like lipase/acylhydrolase family protein